VWFWNGVLNEKVLFVLDAALERIAVRCGVFVLGMLGVVELLSEYEDVDQVGESTLTFVLLCQL